MTTATSTPAGDIIEVNDGVLQVPDRPIVAWIEGDGIGPDLWKALHPLFAEAVRHCYGTRREIAWAEIYAGGKANERFESYLPDETLEAIAHYKVALKGPLMTPVGGGIRSVNVRLRQKLDLYACVRPVRWFEGVPSPVKKPELVDMVVFRENTEDVYCGYEVQSYSPMAAQLMELCAREMGWYIRHDSGIGIKPISETGSKRLIRAAIRYALANGRKTVTFVHKGNIMKFTEGAFRGWGYALVHQEFADVAAPAETHGGKDDPRILINDVIADNFLQMALLAPQRYEVIATMNLNGDYISDALAAQVGGIGIAPGANINYDTGIAIFEATHGTAPNLAGTGRGNPCSVLLSGAMLFEYLGWTEVNEVLQKALAKTFRDGIFTDDLAALQPGVTGVGCVEFAQAVAARLGA